jgi:hypothetical protein
MADMEKVCALEQRLVSLDSNSGSYSLLANFRFL